MKRTTTWKLLTVLTLVVSLVAAATTQTAIGNRTALAAAATTQPAAQEQDRLRWQKAMEQLPVPGKGCFTGSYPAIQWRSVPCKTAPKRPYIPAHGPRPQTVGNTVDYAAHVTGLMSSATGSFDSVSGVTSESDGTPNTFSLQLNTNPFSTPMCSGSGTPGICQGWEQFVYSNTGWIFIQYWLLSYNASCPAGWNTYGGDCWVNGPANTITPVVITDLGTMRLTGTAGAGSDTAKITDGAGNASATSVGSMLHLSSGWTDAEFGVFGDCCGSQANFNAGSSVVVRTTVHNGTTNAPTCVMEGFTGETNNLNLVDTPSLSMGPAPSIASTQTSSPGVASCKAAKGFGDTHMTTFGGLLYDFQASGDFLYAQTDPHFMVETRQVSGAPTWPNAAVNQAVATHIGTSDVAVCSAPTRLVINSKPVYLPDGTQLNLPDGGDVFRQGNVYLIRGRSGDSVRAEVNAGSPSWINVSVGLGRWPEQVRGLLANAGNNVNALAARDGTVLYNPFAFEAFYHRYGDSWRVPASESLLSACGRQVAGGDPRTVFYAQDLQKLQPDLYQRAHTICVGAGVQGSPLFNGGPLLDGCTLDVAVLHNKSAATVFVHAPTPLAVGRILPP